MLFNVATGLRSLLKAKSVVLYGASDKSNWSQAIFASTRSFGFDGPMYAVNRNGTPAHGLQGFKSCKELPEQVEAAFVYVPTDGVLDAFRDLGAAGIKSAIVLSSGFAEAGPEGQALQDELAELARNLGITFLGPNSMGFADVTRGNAITAMRPSYPFDSGGVALISQSGAVCYEIMEYALQQGVGLSWITAVGNEALVDLPEVIDAMIDDERVSAIALFVETIRRPDRFMEVALRAMAKRKPIIMLKVGVSEVSAAIAQAHTGSLIGDDRILDVACQKYGVIRVRSMEDLINTAGLLVHTGVIDRPGIGAASLSGGTSSLLADAAEKAGVPVPAFAPETAAALREILPDFAGTLNPLDVTGMGFNDLTLWGRCLEIISRDPNVGLTICAGTFLPLGAVTPQVGEAMARIGSKGILLSPTNRPIDPKIRDARGIPAAFAGIDGILASIAHATKWSAQVSKPLPDLKVLIAEAAQARPRTERQTLDHLARFGVPVIPAAMVTTAQGASEAARAMGNGAFALKIASPDIQHKTEVGGVKLDVRGDVNIAAAFDEIEASVRAARPDAEIEGVIVSPMRDRGTELIVGTINDPDWGPAIVVGLGGVWVEVLKDSALRLLPVTKQDALEMLESLRAVELLRGYRGAEPADFERVAEVIVAIGDAALALGPDLATLEINPLRVVGHEVEALDGLVIFDDDVAAEGHA